MTPEASPVALTDDELRERVQRTYEALMDARPTRAADILRVLGQLALLVATAISEQMAEDGHAAPQTPHELLERLHLYVTTPCPPPARRRPRGQA